jgi:uncharacterized protein
MRSLLGWIEVTATRWPKRLIAGLIVLTLGFVALARTNEFEVDLTALGRDDAEAVQAMDRVQSEFNDPGATVQVILDAGPGGDMLTHSGLETMSHAGELLASTLGSDLRPAGDEQPPIVSLATALGDLDAADIHRATDMLLAERPQLATLVSDDFDPAEGARATVVIALLDPDLSESERTDAALRVEAAFAAEQLDAAVTVYSLGLFAEGMLEAVRAEVPQMFGLALLVVLVILVLMYRSAFDVAIGFAGLIMTVIWTFGFAGLLGPSNLGWIGPLSQLAIVIPVLLVGLGIDYSVHLTARYREQRATGQSPEQAAGRSLHTVGVALILATVATAIGFATTATAPLGLLADFGILVAMGVVCAFIVMALLVPAARVLRDRRAKPTAGQVRQLRLGKALQAPIALAQRSPITSLAVAAVLVSGSLAAGFALDTRFERRDFVPENTEIDATLAHQEELFGAGVTEMTFALVDGNLADPEIIDAVDSSQRNLAAVPGVRAIDDSPQAFLITAPDSQTGLVQIRTTVGDAEAERLHDDVLAAFTPVVAAGAEVTVTSEPIIIAGMNADLASFQVRSIVVTLSVVLGLLLVFYLLTHRRPALGAIAMIPAVVGASLIVGTMWLAGYDFNILTATLTAIAIGIGVPYGVHVVNRFVENSASMPPRSAVASTLSTTGGALTGSALTTLGALVVLATSGLGPIQSLGLLGGAGIAFALLAAVFVTPSALVLWETRHRAGTG